MRRWDDKIELEAPQGPAGWETLPLTLRFITPVFGGGVDPKKQDPITPVRASALRGQLRFWWRATSPLTSTSELREAEARLFGGVHGGTPRASRVEVSVTRQPSTFAEKKIYEDDSPFRTERDVGRGLAYGAFPLRATDRPLRHDRLIIYRGDFEIALRFPEDEADEVNRALGAFLNFGGLGGRVRRGFGAVELVKGPASFVLPNLDAVPRGSASAPWPTLGRHALSRNTGDPERMHDLALAKLFEMRQGPGTGRVDSRPRPGRSFWPEPDAIRAIYKGQVRGRHTERKLDIDKFPRAAFGAPIIFHFKTDRGEREPPDTTLVPRGKSRLASPLLLRPWRDPISGQHHALAAQLVEDVGDWELKERDRTRASVDVHLSAAEAGQVKPLEGRSDPVEAYLERLREV